MDAPEELVEAAACALFVDVGGNDEALWDDGVDRQWKRSWREMAATVLAVPAIADALARDAKVAEIVRQVDNHPPSVPEAYRSNSGLFVRIFNLYPDADS